MNQIKISGRATQRADAPRPSVVTQKRGPSSPIKSPPCDPRLTSTVTLLTSCHEVPRGGRTRRQLFVRPSFASGLLCPLTHYCRDTALPWLQITDIGLYRRSQLPWQSRYPPTVNTEISWRLRTHQRSPASRKARHAAAAHVLRASRLVEKETASLPLEEKPPKTHSFPGSGLFSGHYAG